MGDRAVIALKAAPTIGVYVHWAGNEDSVRSFLEQAKRECRTPGHDSTYALAGLIGIITDHAHGTRIIGERISVGVGLLSELDTDNGDNGLYWIGDNWEIVRREFNT